MKLFLSLCLFIILFTCIPALVIADVDPTPYPASLFESVLGQYTDCSWAMEGIAYFFTGTPYDSDIFAERYDGENYIFTIMTVADGKVKSIMESSAAIFQEPVTELYCEVYNEINIFLNPVLACFIKKMQISNGTLKAIRNAMKTAARSPSPCLMDRLPITNTKTL